MRLNNLLLVPEGKIEISTPGSSGVAYIPKNRMDEVDLDGTNLDLTMELMDQTRRTRSISYRIRKR